MARPNDTHTESKRLLRLKWMVGTSKHMKEVPVDISFEAFLISAWNLVHPITRAECDIELTYDDEDGDSITIATEDALRVAIRDHLASGCKHLRISIGVPPSRSPTSDEVSTIQLKSACFDSRGGSSYYGVAFNAESKAGPVTVTSLSFRPKVSDVKVQVFTTCSGQPCTQKNRGVKNQWKLIATGEFPQPGPLEVMFDEPVVVDPGSARGFYILSDNSSGVLFQQSPTDAFTVEDDNLRISLGHYYTSAAPFQSSSFSSVSCSFTGALGYTPAVYNLTHTNAALTLQRELRLWLCARRHRLLKSSTLRIQRYYRKDRARIVARYAATFIQAVCRASEASRRMVTLIRATRVLQHYVRSLSSTIGRRARWGRRQRAARVIQVTKLCRTCSVVPPPCCDHPIPDPLPFSFPCHVPASFALGLGTVFVRTIPPILGQTLVITLTLALSPSLTQA